MFRSDSISLSTTLFINRMHWSTMVDQTSLWSTSSSCSWLLWSTRVYRVKNWSWSLWRGWAAVNIISLLIWTAFECSNRLVSGRINCIRNFRLSHWPIAILSSPVNSFKRKNKSLGVFPRRHYLVSNYIKNWKTGRKFENFNSTGDFDRRRWWPREPIFVTARKSGATAALFFFRECQVYRA